VTLALAAQTSSASQTLGGRKPTPPPRGAPWVTRTGRWWVPALTHNCFNCVDFSICFKLMLELLHCFCFSHISVLLVLHFVYWHTLLLLLCGHCAVEGSPFVPRSIPWPASAVFGRLGQRSSPPPHIINQFGVAFFLRRLCAGSSRHRRQQRTGGGITLTQVVVWHHPRVSAKGLRPASPTAPNKLIYNTMAVSRVD